MDEVGFGDLQVGIAGEDDVLALGEGAADGVEGFAPHHDGMAGGLFFEEFEVFGEVPRKGAIASDDAFGGHGNDGGEFHGFR